MSPITGLGLGGPARAYATFAGKAAVAIPAARITGLGLGGPMKAYAAFGAKTAASTDSEVSALLVIARRRGRR